MYSKQELTPELLNSLQVQESVYSVIKQWVDKRESLSFSEYDEESEIWNFGIMMFSENYFDMLSMMVILQGISGYIEKDPSNCIIIYDFIRGSDYPVHLFLRFSEGKVIFSEPSEAELQSLNSFLDSKYESLTQQFKD